MKKRIRILIGLALSLLVVLATTASADWDRCVILYEENPEARPIGPAGYREKVTVNKDKGLAFNTTCYMWEIAGGGVKIRCQRRGGWLRPGEVVEPYDYYTLSQDFNCEPWDTPLSDFTYVWGLTGAHSRLATGLVGQTDYHSVAHILSQVPWDEISVEAPSWLNWSKDLCGNPWRVHLYGSVPLGAEGDYEVTVRLRSGYSRTLTLPVR